MKVPLLDLKAQYATIRDEVRAAVDEVLDSQHFILGPKVEQLEQQVAQYTGAAHGIGVTSGSDALIVALMALDVGPGDAVITTPYTFFATVGAIWRVGATPVMADIDAATYNIDPKAVADLLAKWPARFAKLKPRALIPVHLFGQCADMDPLLAAAKRHGLAVIEDAAQAIGAEYPSARGVLKAGAMGDMGCFSFFPSKNLGGAGDGGMVVTSDAALAERLRLLRNHGAKPKYYHSVVGGNFRLDALQAAILAVKLKRLDQWHAGRRANAARYDAALAGSRVATPRAVYAGSGAKHAHIYNQYVVRVPDRDRVREQLAGRGVGSEVYYPVSMHEQKCFAALGYARGDFPRSEEAASNSLAVPVYPEMTGEMIDFVARALRELAGG